ncbi:MAG TPA: DUF488 family protein [Terriglobales bacterium]|jgi:uncharacterized protein YeaO (DUF488 family)|nr:DUF488 family protein [Terriglobales bacterium]
MAPSESIALKRVYDAPDDSDGHRVLVDRLWPRGLTKEEARLDLWLRDLAPSNQLRKWFHSNPEHWKEFRQRYLTELRTAAAENALTQLYGVLDREGRVTLVFASKRADRNNATVLKEFVEGMKKPPRGSGEQRTRAQRRR